MTGQNHDLPSRHAMPGRPIVRPLPSADGSAGRRRDAPGTMPWVQLLVDPGWFEAYWYAAAPVPRPGFFGDLVRRSRGRLADMSRRLAVHLSRQPVVAPTRG
jgi:hypothetical protein